MAGCGVWLSVGVGVFGQRRFVADTMVVLCGVFVSFWFSADHAVFPWSKGVGSAMRSMWFCPIGGGAVAPDRHFGRG